MSNPKTSISFTRKLWFPVRKVLPTAHWYVLLRVVVQLLVFGALWMRISWALPPPNTGPYLLLHQIEYPSCSALKRIFVGRRPLGLTRLNRNEFCALLYPEEPWKYKCDLHTFISRGFTTRFVTNMTKSNLFDRFYSNCFNDTGFQESCTLYRRWIIIVLLSSNSELAGIRSASRLFRYFNH